MILYESDGLAWAEQQAALLERLASGERVNADVDWPNLIEEVRDVGLSELRACRSLLRQAMLHLLKLHAWPASRAALHWREETARFLVDAADCFTPSMRQRIDLAAVYAWLCARSAAADAIRPAATAARDLPVHAGCAARGRHQRTPRHDLMGVYNFDSWRVDPTKEAKLVK